MEWIESHKSLARHPKTKRLARALDVSIPTAIGHLHLLWWWSTDYAEDGQLTRYEAEDIADAAMWEGDAAEFVTALQRAGWLDEDMYLHDWQDYSGKLIEKRKDDAARKRNARLGLRTDEQGEEYVPDTSTGHPTDIHETAHVPYPTLPNHTIHNPTEPNKTVPKESRGDQNFDLFADEAWRLWPARLGKKLNKAKAATYLKRIPARDRDAVIAAIHNFAASSQARRDRAPDLFRWLRDEAWKDWQQPEVVPSKNGRGEYIDPNRPEEGYSWDRDEQGKWISLAGNEHGYPYGASDPLEVNRIHREREAEYKRQIREGAV